MKEKYKAIIKRYFSDETTGESGEVENSDMERYTYATSLEKAENNIRYHLKKDDGIDLDYTYGQGNYSTWYGIDKIALEKEFETKRKGRGKDKKPRHRRTKEELNNEKKEEGTKTTLFFSKNDTEYILECCRYVNMTPSNMMYRAIKEYLKPIYIEMNRIEKLKKELQEKYKESED